LQALAVALERLQRRNGRLAQITLSELAEEYLAQHEAEPRTIAKLRWLLVKASAAFGDRRVSICGRMRSPRGGRRCPRVIASRRPRRCASC
jgi:hypothetical protein